MMAPTFSQSQEDPNESSSDMNQSFERCELWTHYLISLMHQVSMYSNDFQEVYHFLYKVAATSRWLSYCEELASFGDWNQTDWSTMLKAGAS
jgi:hypothetical protein